MGDMEEARVLCYNRGCGKEFKEAENSFNACHFHPGTPFFHEGYKGWTCCRKSTDFTEFLNMKGCATGYHSNVKPPEPEKKKEVINEEFVAQPQVAQPKSAPLPRPDVNAPLIVLSPTLSESLKKQTYQDAVADSPNKEADQGIKPGVTQCVNKGCTTRYEGPQTDSEICKHHPGVPIFHEGLKYWSCCQKKTMDFDVFMKQEGCQTGSHLWIKPKENNSNGEGGTKLIKCKQDWHQDGSFVHIVVYGGGKKFNPLKSHVKVNGVKFNVELNFPEENSMYQETLILAGIIIPEQSSVLMTPMKVEVKLKKAEPVHWTNLNISEESLKRNIQAEKNEEEHKNVGVDPVDLSDL